MRGLAEAIRQVPDLELGLAFFCKHGGEPVSVGNVTWIPMRRPGGLPRRIVRALRPSSADRTDCSLCRSVVSGFRPDLIHVFGTEQMFGLLSGILETPVVIHLQGLMGPYMNAWVPPFHTFADYVRRGHTNPLRIAMGALALSLNRHAARRELEIMRCGSVFLGRTAWDRTYVSLYAPQAVYYHCEEALRSEFFRPVVRKPPASPVFVSTLSSPLYKGHDVVLKTANVLCETGHGGFEWRVFGVSSLRFAEKKTGICADDVHVRACGHVSGERLRSELLGCTALVHPSYVDNSPNSICEAQVLGVPCIAANVGGVASIVADGKTGYLVPANDPLMTARCMIGIASGRMRLPDDWTTGPRARNDPAKVADRVLEIYRTALSRK